MAYYSSLASSYPDLITQLVNACIANGWVWSDSILSKGTAFLRIIHNPTAAFDNGGGIQFQGGTGKSATTLINASSAVMRIGPFGTPPLLVPSPTFPLQYHFFIFENPDEVYIVVKYDNDRFLFAGFGLSTVPGNGLWLSANLGLRSSSGVSGTSISISNTSGGWAASSNYVSSSGFFWQNQNVSGLPVIATQTIYSTIDNVGWTYLSTSSANTPANRLLDPLISRLPAVWSSETVLLPIQPLMQRSAFKSSILADIQNARYLRIDNLEPEQILTIGNEKWMVFPFHKKNISVRNGGSGIDHTGTFGWAIRYDGP